MDFGEYALIDPRCWVLPLRRAVLAAFELQGRIQLGNHVFRRLTVWRFGGVAKHGADSRAARLPAQTDRDG